MDNTTYIEKLREVASAFAKAFANLWQRIKAFISEVRQRFVASKRELKHIRPKYRICKHVNKLKHQVMANKPFVVRIRNTC